MRKAISQLDGTGDKLDGFSRDIRLQEYFESIYGICNHFTEYKNGDPLFPLSSNNVYNDHYISDLRREKIISLAKKECQKRLGISPIDALNMDTITYSLIVDVLEYLDTDAVTRQTEVYNELMEGMNNE